MGLTLALMSACFAASAFTLGGFSQNFFIHVVCSLVGLVLYGLFGHSGTRFGRVFFSVGAGVVGTLALMVGDPWAVAAAAVCILGSLFTPDAR